jgi:hypothetical protein
MQEHMPVKYTDLYPGDMLYNPDFQWHAIKNYGGLSFGVPIREFNTSLSFRNNPIFASIALVNKVAEKLGLDIGGWPTLKVYQED